MKNTRPLDDLEMHELLRLIYPQHIRSDDDEYFDLSADVCDNTMIDLGDGFEVSLAELLGRVVMMTMPMQSALGGGFSHCLGEVMIKDGAAHMMAVVRRPAKIAEVQLK